jgi:hypothetical protein
MPYLTGIDIVSNDDPAKEIKFDRVTVTFFYKDLTTSKTTSSSSSTK